MSRVRVEARLPERPPLAEQVPELVQRDFQAVQAEAVVVGGRPGRLALPELVLLGDEILDTGVDSGLVHSGSLTRRARPCSRSSCRAGRSGLETRAWVASEAGITRLVSSEARVCPVCGLLVSPESRFCSQCGTQLDGGSRAGPSSRRVFGILAPAPVLVLACVLLIAGIVVLVAGSPIAAIVLLAFAAASFVLFYGAVERDPADPVARRALTSGHRVRGWAAFASRSFRAWAEAARVVTKQTTHSRSLRREQKRGLYLLGDATYREDEASVEALRSRLREVDQALIAAKEARATSVAKAREHVREEHVAVQPTQRFSVRDLSGGDR
jgi:zinc-ribbon domain